MPLNQGPRGGSARENDDSDTKPDEPTRILEKQATFDNIVVWDHEVVPPADDHFVKGVEEWLKLAQAVGYVYLLLLLLLGIFILI